MQFFELFCNDESFQLAVDQSNLYNTQHSAEGYEVAVMSNRKRCRSYKKVAAVTVSKMKHFFGIILFMGFIRYQIIEFTGENSHMSQQYLQP